MQADALVIKLSESQFMSYLFCSIMHVGNLIPFSPMEYCQIQCIYCQRVWLSTSEAVVMVVVVETPRVRGACGVESCIYNLILLTFVSLAYNIKYLMFFQVVQ